MSCVQEPGCHTLVVPWDLMALPLPVSLTPSKVSSFKDCGLQFRYVNIDKLSTPRTPQQAMGTVTHKALELLFGEPAGRRTLHAALGHLAVALPSVLGQDEYQGLTIEDYAAFEANCERLIENYFRLEDPNTVNVVGSELTLEVKLGTLLLRGIIDRLDDVNGDLVVTDYKSGRAPGEKWEAGKLVGVHFYALLVERLYGRRPVRVQLLHLAEPISISTVPTEQSIRGIERKALAIWKAVERACEREDFRPRPSKLCDWCHFKDICPAHNR